jgi:hypothetical protein
MHDLIIIRDDDALPELRMNMPDVVALAQRAARGDAVCPCTRLLGTLAPRERLDADLDHVCDEVMMATVLVWAKTELMDLHWLRELNPWADLQLPWPLHHAHRRLMLVIRQWALEPANEAFARRLDNDSMWQLVVRIIRETPLFLEAISEVDARVPEDDWARLGPQKVLLGLLSKAGLPATPDVLVYLKRTVLGELNPHPPRRGVLVSTLVFAVPPRVFAERPRVANGGWRFHDGNPMQITAGALEYKHKRPVSEELTRIEANHLAFLRRFRQMPIASRVAVNRANAMSRREPKTLDYMEEALDGNAIERIVRRCRLEKLSNPGPLISEHIDKCDERVGRRRDRAKPRQPRLGAWKQRGYAEVHAAVQRLLSQEGVNL